MSGVTHMDKTSLYFRDMADFVNRKLEQCMPSVKPELKTLQEAMNYSLQSGGKRIRPLICFFVGELFDTPRDRLVSAACALEMIHTASLIMDDLPYMDDAKMRRGRPANHLVYGQDVAALASIGLLTMAYGLVLDDRELSDKKKTMVVNELVNAVGLNGMVGGQFVDISSEEFTEFPTLERIHTYKTASLFVAAGSTAAIIGNATKDELKHIKEYSKNEGIAFQILDDILDSTGKAEEVGKSLRNDKANFIASAGPEKQSQLIMEYTNKAIGAIETFGVKSNRLIALAQMLLSRKL